MRSWMLWPRRASATSTCRPAAIACGTPSRPPASPPSMAPPPGRWPSSPAPYPDSAIEIVDESFAKCRIGNAAVERLATGFRWSEGPVWFGDGRYLLWSDIPNDRILKWEEETGRVSVFRKPSHNANGNTRDRQGRLLTCEHDTRRVTRTEYDGTITVIAERHDGKPLNSPNDIVCKSDGSIWFTDPPFGVLGYYEGHKDAPELPTNVYRVDPGTGRLTVVAGDVDGARLASKRKLIDAGPGTPDGLRVDVDGNLWIGWGMGEEGLDGVAVFSPEGKLIGRIDLPGRCANVCSGGALRNRLFM